MGGGREEGGEDREKGEGEGWEGKPEERRRGRRREEAGNVTMEKGETRRAREAWEAGDGE